MGGAAGAGALCPLVITTADSQTNADAITPTIDRFQLRVIEPLARLRRVPPLPAREGLADYTCAPALGQRELFGLG
jgi:hypothetical protein